VNDHRGWGVLKQVYAQLSRRREVELHLFGSDALPAVGADVVNHGRVPPADLPALYSSADVFVDASLTHGFGRTGVEAMACGTATVLSRSGGPDEYAVNERNCLMVEVNDAEGTVMAVERLIDDEALRRRIAASGYETVQGYGDARAAAAMVQLWHRELSSQELSVS
jgi:glycosyltransferase involved in cell wall biosynthesis